jgi:hypothetical protein
MLFGGGDSLDDIREIRDDTETFSLSAFLGVVATYLGKELAPYERDELELAFNTVGPFSEPCTRVALEHAIRIRGRHMHVSIYTHDLKVFQLAALRANGGNDENP